MSEPLDVKAIRAALKKACAPSSSEGGACGEPWPGTGWRCSLPSGHDGKHDWSEGKRDVLSAPPSPPASGEAHPIVAVFEEISKTVPPEEWKKLPSFDEHPEPTPALREGMARWFSSSSGDALTGDVEQGRRVVERLRLTLGHPLDGNQADLDDEDKRHVVAYVDALHAQRADALQMLAAVTAERDALKHEMETVLRVEDERRARLTAERDALRVERDRLRGVIEFAIGKLEPCDAEEFPEKVAATPEGCERCALKAALAPSKDTETGETA